MEWVCTWLPVNHGSSLLSDHSLAIDSRGCSVLSQLNMDCCLESFWKYMLRHSTRKFIKNGGQDDKLQIQRIYLCLYICSNIRPWTDCFSPGPNLTLRVVMKPWCCLRDYLLLPLPQPHHVLSLLFCLYLAVQGIFPRPLPVWMLPIFQIHLKFYLPRESPHLL